MSQMLFNLFLYFFILCRSLLFTHLHSTYIIIHIEFHLYKCTLILTNNKREHVVSYILCVAVYSRNLLSRTVLKMSSNKMLNCLKPNSDFKCSKVLKKINLDLAKKIPNFNVKSESELLNYRICSSCYLFYAKQESNIKVPPNKDFDEQEHEQKREHEQEILCRPEMMSPKPSTSAVAAISSTNHESSTPESINPPTPDEEQVIKKQRMLETIPEFLSADHSPIYLSRLGRKRNQEKLKTVSEMINKHLLKEEIVPISKIEDIQQKANCYDEMVKQLKDRFMHLDNVPDKIQLLTVMPLSLPHRKIQEEFDCTRHMVRISKNLLSTAGALSKPGPKKGCVLSDEIVDIVNKFFEDSDIARVMPGKNDCMAIRINGEKQTFQKRLMLSTLKESYEEFKKRHNDIKIGFTKFTMLKPKHFVQLGSSGTHSVCVCTIHQNVKIMMANVNFAEISDGLFKTYKDCILFVLCEAPQPDCFMMKCSSCPGIDKLKDKLNECFDHHDMENCEIQFNQWLSTDRCNLETLVKPADDFVEYFADKLKKLIPHHFISSEQSNFVRDMKDKLKPGEFLVCCDFAENYSFGKILLIYFYKRI